MRKLILSLCLFVPMLVSQVSFAESADELYHEAYDLYSQRKYAASQSCFERFLATNTHTLQRGMQQDAEFYVAAIAYTLKQERAFLLLENYVEEYPNSPYLSRANFMLGRLRYEEKKYKYALRYYQNVDEKELGESECREYKFTKAYCLLEMKKYDEAKSIFKALSNEKNEFSQTALYYYSYIEYLQKNNDVALQGFLALEQLDEYADVVPYYIVQIYYDDCQYEKALEHGRIVLDKNPNNPNNSEIYKIMGECAYRGEKYSEAVNYLKKHESIAKKIQRNASYMLGVSYFKTEDYKSAEAYLTKVTSQTDSIAQNAYLYLGYSYLKLNQKSKAKLAFESASKMDFDVVIKEESLYNYAIASYETAAAFGEALSALERFVNEFPQSKYIDTIYDHVVAVFLTNKNYASAYQSILKMKVLTPRMKEVKEYVLFQLGTQAFAKSDFKNAVKMFTASIEEATPKSFSSQAYLWRGESNYRIREYGEARADYQKFIEKSQKKDAKLLSDAYYGVAYTYFSEKKYKEALPWFEKFVKRTSPEVSNTAYWDALNRLGDCNFYVRNFSVARTYYSKVIDNNAKGADYALFQNAFILGLQKKYADKIALLEKMLNTMPNSDYCSNALYEIGRSYVMLEKNEKAITVYDDVLKKYPKSPLARKAALEIGMLYFNMANYDQAKMAYRNVIERYKGSDEARMAFESLESLHVETNDVQAFLDYCKTLGKNYVAVMPDKRSDSLSFVAAERIYIKGDYKEAIPGLQQYLKQYCSTENMGNCIAARYYLADSYYQTQQYGAALNEYEALVQLDGNKYMEQALIRAAEITYNEQKYDSSLKYFKQLQLAASNAENRNMARLGVLRCSFLLKEHETTLSVANEILKTDLADSELERESRYNRAKVLIALNRRDEAQPDLELLSKDLLQETGAEAKYLYAEYFYLQGDYKKSEEEIFDFISKNTPYQYWLAKGFVLLSDIYVAQEDDFQAKQYLISLRDNYTAQDSIQDLIKERLDKILAREKTQTEE